jgi:hypothetical protein
MNFTPMALALVWMMVLGLFVLSASATVVARDGLLWLVLGGLVTPAFVLALTAHMRRSTVLVVPVDGGSVAAPDRREGDANGR